MKKPALVLAVALAIAADTASAEDVRPGQIALEIQALSVVRSDLFKEAKTLAFEAAVAVWLGAANESYCDDADMIKAAGAGSRALAPFLDQIRETSNDAIKVDKDGLLLLQGAFTKCITSASDPLYSHTKIGGPASFVALQEAGKVAQLSHYIADLRNELLDAISGESR